MIFSKLIQLILYMALFSSIVNSGAYRIINGTCNQASKSSRTLAEDGKCPKLSDKDLMCIYTTATPLTSTPVLVLLTLSCTLLMYHWIQAIASLPKISQHRISHRVEWLLYTWHGLYYVFHFMWCVLFIRSSFCDIFRDFYLCTWIFFIVCVIGCNSC